ncbi:MAG: TIGR01777 family oxidoreductase [Bacteroidota bacterium]
MREKVVVFGATGFIASNLINILIDKYEVVAVSRSLEGVKKKFPENVIGFEWDYRNTETIVPVLYNSFAVINLTGENISNRRWTTRQKTKILSSRVDTARIIINALNKCGSPPKAYLQGSAIGYYRHTCIDNKNEQPVKGMSFLSNVVKLWEKETILLRKDVRLIIIRTGVVIAKNAGMLQKFRLPFKFGFGGYIGSGKQWISWIHIEDEVRAIKFLMEKNSTSGVYNLAAPEPLIMKDFIKIFADELKKKSWFHIPSFIMRMLYGQMAEEIILNGVKVLPKRLLKEEYHYIFNDFRSAMKKNMF